MPRLRGVNRLCSSNIAEMRICGYRAEEKILCRSPISQRSHVGNLRQTLQGKGVIHKRVETAGVYPLMLPRRVPQFPAASAAISRGECRNFPRRVPQFPAASAAISRGECRSPPRRVPQSPAVPQRTLRPETANRSHGSGTPESPCREIFARKAHAGATLPTFSLVQCRKMRYTYFI